MILTLLIAAAVTAGSGSRSAKPDARHAPTGGTLTAMQSLERAYETMNPDALDALYTADYQYIVVREEGDSITIPTFDRDQELLSARNLFRGVSKDGKVALPPARTVTVTMKGLSENPDPQRPDSALFYRLIVCEQFGLVMKMGNGVEVQTAPTLHVFQLVRGDVAALTATQKGDPSRWYIRRWFDDVKGLEKALALRKGDCEPEPAPLSDIVPGTRLAIAPLGNPACPTVDVMCVIPKTGSATVELFDITGRRVHRQSIQVAQAGPQKVHAGAGATVKPGAYFVRVSQGTAFASQKVLVAK